MELDTLRDLAIKHLDSEIARLQKLRAEIYNASGVVVDAEFPEVPDISVHKPMSRLSPEARKRISDAQKKRWAAIRAAKKGGRRRG